MDRHTMTFRYLEGYCNDEGSAQIAPKDAGSTAADSPAKETGRPDASATAGPVPPDGADPGPH